MYRPVDRPAQKAPDKRKGTALHWVRVGSNICDQTVFFEIVADPLIVRLIIFKICRSSNAPFLNLGATGFRSEWRARAPRREPSEGCFSEPRLQVLASHPVCQKSISALFCLQRVSPTSTVYCQMLAFGTTFVHWVLRRILS